MRLISKEINYLIFVLQKTLKYFGFYYVCQDWVRKCWYFVVNSVQGDSWKPTLLNVDTAEAKKQTYWYQPYVSCFDFLEICFVLSEKWHYPLQSGMQQTLLKGKYIVDRIPCSLTNLKVCPPEIFLSKPISNVEHLLLSLHSCMYHIKYWMPFAIPAVTI